MAAARTRMLIRAALAAATLAGMVQAGPARAAAVTLAETGSTLMLPLLQSWAAGYGQANPDVHLTLAGTGSGQGIADASTGAVQLGASDAYMSDVEEQRHPGLLNIPLAISAQLIGYNLPGAGTLKLSGPVLAAIYAGSIRRWNDTRIAQLNGGMALPDQAIIPIHRADGSGDTFIFSQFLTFSTPSWEDGPGYGTAIAWPSAAGEQTATGNDGMVSALGKTPYSVGYVGGSFAAQLSDAKLGVAMLQNESGKFVAATQETIAAAAAALTPRTPRDERLTLAYAPGDLSYPLINYEYAMVQAHQADPAMAAALRDFLTWAVTPGQGSTAAFLDPVHFIALPTAIRALSETQIAQIH